MQATTYKHTQIGWAVLVIGAAAFAICFARLGADHTIRAIVPLAIVVICVVLFSTLTVEADERSIEARFGPGLIRRRLEWSQIRSTRLIRNTWVLGFGIRRIRSGWMFNVSGRDALELELETGSRFRIGTDDPVALGRYAAERLRQPGPR